MAIGTGARGGSSSAGGSVAVGGGAAATGTQAIAIGGLYGNDLYSSSATKDGAGNLTKNHNYFYFFLICISLCGVGFLLYARDIMKKLEKEYFDINVNTRLCV